MALSGQEFTVIKLSDEGDCFPSLYKTKEDLLQITTKEFTSIKQSEGNWTLCLKLWK